MKVLIVGYNRETKESKILIEFTTTLVVDNIYSLVLDSFESARKHFPHLEITAQYGETVSTNPMEWTEETNFITSMPLDQEKDEEKVDAGFMSFDEYEAKWYPNRQPENDTTHDQYDADGCGYWN